MDRADGRPTKAEVAGWERATAARQATGLCAERTPAGAFECDEPAARSGLCDRHEAALWARLA